MTNESKEDKILVGAYMNKEFVMDMDIHRIRKGFKNRGDFFRSVLEKEVANGRG